MKLMIASDIHGSAYWCRRLVEMYEALSCDKMILLGDILYHGPRNDLPDEYSPKKVIELLNNISDEIIAVKGNCEAEVDQMVLNFCCMSDSAIIYEKGIMLYMTHGHIFNCENLPKLKKGDILIHGHTHIPAIEQFGENIYINPGSVSIPKMGNTNTFMIYENGAFTIYDFELNIIKSYSMAE